MFAIFPLGVPWKYLPVFCNAMKIIFKITVSLNKFRKIVKQSVHFTTGSGGFGGGFNMNPMALAGMMSMFMNQMGGMGSMGMGNMGGGSMGNMGMNSRGSGDGMGSRGGDPGDSFRGPSSSSDGYKSNNYSSGSVSTSNTTGSDGVGYGAQNSSMYGDQAGGGMGDMSAYANAMSAMFGAAGVSPANVQAALYNAYGGGGGGTGSGSGQMGAYDQSSSAYGPARNSSTSTNRGYKPY